MSSGLLEIIVAKGVCTWCVYAYLYLFQLLYSREVWVALCSDEMLHVVVGCWLDYMCGSDVPCLLLSAVTSPALQIDIMHGKSHGHLAKNVDLTERTDATNLVESCFIQTFTRGKNRLSSHSQLTSKPDQFREII